MIIKTEREYYHTNNKLRKLICIPPQKVKIPKCLHFIHTRNLLTAKKRCFPSINLYFFQLATGGIESAVYKKLIAPFMNDLPASHSDGFRRACTDHKYAYFGPKFLIKFFSLSLPCQLVPLPDTSYMDPWAFIISKNSSYKCLINWRWDNKMKSIRYITVNSQLLWVPRQSLKTGGHFCLLTFIRVLTKPMYEYFVTFLIIVLCCWISL
jgi:hypothetical protein